MWQFLWSVAAQRRQEYKLRNVADFNLPAPRTEFFKRQPIYSLPLIWNEFNDMKFQPNRITFQKYVKEYCWASLNSKKKKKNNYISFKKNLFLASGHQATCPFSYKKRSV